MVVIAVVYAYWVSSRPLPVVSSKKVSGVGCQVQRGQSSEVRRQMEKLEGEVILPVFCYLSSEIFSLKPDT
jgi:Tfp pilus assembly protein PilZ